LEVLNLLMYYSTYIYISMDYDVIFIVLLKYWVNLHQSWTTVGKDVFASSKGRFSHSPLGFLSPNLGNTHHPEYHRMGILITLNNLFQMKPTRCTLLFVIFISTSLQVLGNYVPIIRRTCCIYVTLVFFVLCGWLSGLPPIQNKKYQCCIGTASSPDDGHIVAQNM